MRSYKEEKIQKCALMNCELEKDTPILFDMLNSKSEMIAYQAKMLIEVHGFKPTDKMCVDCFWK